MDTMANTAQAAQSTEAVSWFEKMKTTLHLDKFQFSTNKLIEIGMYLGFGFLIGYALKRYSTVVLIIVLTVVALFLLHQFEIISIAVNPEKVREFLGIKQAVDGNLFAAYWDWIKDNFILVMSFIVGFLVGIRLG
jgi:uncharacterized membrane protein (Fun14 family)